MSIEWGWRESGRGAAPQPQRVVVTAKARTDAAFDAYSTHLSTCRECDQRTEAGEPLCAEAKRLGQVYLAADRVSRGASHAEA